MNARRVAILALLALATTLPFGTAAAIDLPPQFVSENVTPGTIFQQPTGVAFLPGGRMLVAEKRGRVYSVVNGVKSANPLISRENEVLNVSDRGLIGIAVDPNYVSNRYVYLMYTVDPDSNGNDNNDDAFGRITRYQVSAADSNVFDPASRTILLGVDWRRGALSASQSHTIGDLQFGADGSLLVTIGDGAQFNQTDKGGVDNNAFGTGANKTDPFEDIGAFRAQYIGSLCGKILRINPANGHGYSSNPFWDGDPTSVRSRVWAYGLRNPFRFCVRPNTGVTDPAAGNPGTIYVGDVGWNIWEDQHVATAGGRNFGWPCFEGYNQQFLYSGGTPPAHHGCGTIGTSENPSPHTPPLASWNHEDAPESSPPGDIGNAAVGGVFYTRTTYPTQYRGQYFFADYGQNWIKVMRVNGANQILELLDFADDAAGPVSLDTDPATGDLIYVAIATGEVRRIRYTGGTGGNTPPIAVADATPSVGSSPLLVQFSSAASNDADLDPLTVSWLFGDGQGSSAANPQHTYPSPGSYDAILTVDDAHGGIGRDTVRIIVVNSTFPTTTVLDNFNRANGAIGGSWVDQTNGLAINANALTQTCCYGSTVWNGPNGIFGPDQEAFVTLTAVTASAPEHDLMLKVQGTSYAAGHIEVRYTAPSNHVQVATHHPSSGWTQRGAPIPVTFVAGDQFGARAYSNGTIEVYRNGVLIGTRDAGTWPFKALGGRLGLTIDGALSSRFDNFGGGTVVISSNTAPTAQILAPADGAFFVADEEVQLSGTGSDGQQTAGTLQYDWLVDVHHNTHVHPGSYVFTGPTASFTAENHDDGTGVHYGVRLVVTDNGSLRDTAEVAIWPEVDLSPGAVRTIPSTPGTTDSATWSFAIHNSGRMPAPLSRWRLRAGGALLAEGDAIVPPEDSVLVVRRLPPLLAAGGHVVRVTVDTLATVPELVETNNAATRALTVVAGAGPDEVGPVFTAGPTWTATADDATVDWETNEPATGSLRYGLTPALGDSVTTPLGTQHEATPFPLFSDTRYYFRAVATDAAGNTTVGALDSLLTDPGAVGVEPAPAQLALSSARPNPSRGEVSFRLELPQDSDVAFSVHDVQGRRVWSEPRTRRSAGRYELRWSGLTPAGSRAGAGLYLARVEASGRTLVRRIALLK